MEVSISNGKITEPEKKNSQPTETCLRLDIRKPNHIRSLPSTMKVCKTSVLVGKTVFCNMLVGDSINTSDHYRELLGVSDSTKFGVFSVNRLQPNLSPHRPHRPHLWWLRSTAVAAHGADARRPAEPGRSRRTETGRVESSMLLGGSAHVDC